MTEHPHVELTRRGYDAFAKGDLATLSELIADNVTWHVLGVGPLVGAAACAAPDSARGGPVIAP